MYCVTKFRFHPGQYFPISLHMNLSATPHSSLHMTWDQAHRRNTPRPFCQQLSLRHGTVNISQSDQELWSGHNMLVKTSLLCLLFLSPAILTFKLNAPQPERWETKKIKKTRKKCLTFIIIAASWPDSLMMTLLSIMESGALLQDYPTIFWGKLSSNKFSYLLTYNFITGTDLQQLPPPLPPPPPPPLPPLQQWHLGRNISEPNMTRSKSRRRRKRRSWRG